MIESTATLKGMLVKISINDMIFKEDNKIFLKDSKQLQGYIYGQKNYTKESNIAVGPFHPLGRFWNRKDIGTISNKLGLG